jgi:imidazolonepropionase-like amidohydrolase
MRISLSKPIGTGLSLLALCVAVGCQQPPPDGTALVGATLIDGSGGPPLPDAVVVVRRGKIESVGSRADFHLPRRTVEVDATGRWIIPGLIDSHAHVARWALSRYLAWGVTTVRDVHGTLDSILALRKEVNGGTTIGPRIYTAGAMIDGVPTTYSDALPAPNEQVARKQVDRLVNAGVDLIKVYSHVNPPLLRAIIDEASPFHVPVTGHLGLTDAVTAANLGIASIEHMSGVPEAAMADASGLYAAHRSKFFAGWTAFERAWASLDSAALDRVARTLAEKKVSIIPTLVLHETFSRLDDSAVVQDSMLRYVPRVERERWNVPDMVARAGWQKTDYAAFQRSRPNQDLFLRLFAAAGGRIAAGTDAANQLLIPGYSVHRELQLLVSAGFTPRDALLCATRNGAVLLGADSIGIIAPGKMADMVILRRDPMSRVQNTLAIERVMLGGRLFSADSIRASWQ